MSDGPDNLMLRYLRQIDENVVKLAADVAELKHRMTTVEVQLGTLAASEQSHYASVAVRLDRFEVRLDRIERRVGLIDAPLG